MVCFCPLAVSSYSFGAKNTASHQFSLSPVPVIYNKTKTAQPKFKSVELFLYYSAVKSPSSSSAFSAWALLNE